MKRIAQSLFALGGMLFSLSVAAQDTWSLERCVRYAQDNNITVQQAMASAKISQLSEKQAKSARLPNVSGGINAGKQFGRTIDPTSNTFVTTGVGFNSMSLDASVNLFNGGLIHHNVKQANWDVKAAVADAEQSANTLGLQVAQAFLTILLNEEQLENARRRVTQSDQQLNATLKLIEAGSTPLAEKFNLQAQKASDEQAAVVAQNNVDLAYLNLKQLLQLEPDFDLQIERPTVVIPADANPGGMSLTPLYGTAATTQPNIRAAGFRIKSAEEGIAIAKAAYYPSMQAFAQLRSNYSTQFFRPESITKIENPVIPALINGEAALVTLLGQTTEIPNNIQRVKYFTQLDQNFGQTIGFSINVPIYSNGRNNLAVERARLNVLTAQMQSTQAQQTLKNDIQTAIANARAAKLQLEAAEKTFMARQTAFQNMEKRLSLGAVNSLDLTTAKTNMDNAENDLVRAKYDYLFRLKILDFYEGKPLQLN